MTDLFKLVEAARELEAAKAAFDEARKFGPVRPGFTCVTRLEAAQKAWVALAQTGEDVPEGMVKRRCEWRTSEEGGSVPYDGEWVIDGGVTSDGYSIEYTPEEARKVAFEYLAAADLAEANNKALLGDTGGAG